MTRIDWHDGTLTVKRLVISQSASRSLVASARELAVRHDLSVADDGVAPRSGDFWVGCHPANGWGATPSEQIGWVRGPEVPLALWLLRNARDVRQADEQPVWALAGSAAK